MIIIDLCNDYPTLDGKAKHGDAVEPGIWRNQALS